VKRLACMSTICVSLLVAGLEGGLPTPAQAEEPAWEAEVRRAETEEDRLLDHARRRGTTRQVVGRYASRLSRQPTALNHYLLGRALYYDGDPAGAERHLREALRLQPGFWFARLRLAILELERKKPEEAERHLTAVLQVHPEEADALKLMAQIRMEANDWDGALRVLEDLLARDPTSYVVRRNMVLCHLSKEDWAAALRELRVLRGRDPKDPAVRWYYAYSLFRTGDLKQASREFEGMVRLDPQDIRSLDLLQLIYLKLEDWKSLEKTLERMIPLVQAHDAEAAAEMQETVRRLQAGERPGKPPPRDDDTWEPNTLADLIERCMHPTSVQIRREALQSYYAAEPPLMPAALVERVHPDLEPDPVCRTWLLRIMGALRNRTLAPVAAYGLYDPDAKVRAVAAESLGAMATPAALLYLMPYFFGPPLEGEPSENLVLEQNAARLALIQVTGRRHDALGGQDDWVVGASLPALRLDWQTWLTGPEGVAFRLHAIADLEAVGEVRPQAYLIDEVFDPNGDIARAAYGVLLRRADQPSDDAVAKAMWPKFPRFNTGQLADENLGHVRGAIKVWWEAWRAMRVAEREKNGE
jgi:Flp pilus assembly protein TadD/HEAT repeat protein